MQSGFLDDYSNELHKIYPYPIEIYKSVDIVDCIFKRALF